MLTAWGLGAGVFQLRGFCVQGPPLVAPRWLDCRVTLGLLTPSKGRGARPAGVGAAGAALRVCLSEVGPAGTLPGGWGFWVPGRQVCPHLSR